MTSKIVHFFLLTILSLWASNTYSQDPIGTEVINVVKPYSPSVSDAFKIKETPFFLDSLEVSKNEVQYTIFSVPVASTFTPAKGKATPVERKKQEPFFANYATLGFGNFTAILGELYSHFEVSRNEHVSLFLKHNSAQGGIDGIVINDYFYDTSLDVQYKNNDRFLNYGLGLSLLHQIYNWYGLSPQFLTPQQIQFAETAGVDHSFYGASLHGNFNMEDSPFSSGEVRLNYLGDSYSSSEINIIAKPQFRFDLGGQDLGVHVAIDYLNGSFEQSFTDLNSAIKYSYLNSGLHPFIKIQNEEFSANLGAQLVVGMDIENSTSDLYIYPKVDASYNLADQFLTLYAGAQGGLDQNTYFNFSQENPFVSPTLQIAPTNRQYEGYGGIKGKMSNTLSYNFKASYKNELNKPFFLSNPFLSNGSNAQGFEFGNSIGVTYDDVNTLELYGELQAEFTSTITLGVNASYFNYSLENLTQAYNLPQLKATLYGNAAFTKQLYAGLSLFFVGEREELQRFDSLLNVDDINTTLDAFVDINLHAGYHINPQLTVFVKGSNLLSDTYEKWLNTPVLGLQVLGGITYKFDW